MEHNKCVAYPYALIGLMLLPLSVYAADPFFIPPSLAAFAGILLFGWSFVLLSFIIEFACLYTITHQHGLRVLIITILMNTVSAIVSLVVGLNIVDKVHELALVNTLVGYPAFYVPLHTLIEFWIARLLLQPVDTRKLALVVFCTKTLSIGGGLLSAVLYHP